MADSVAEPVDLLLVDDDPSYLELTSTYLSRVSDSFESTTATNAEDGLALLDDDPVDCVVSDYQMPGMDGLDFLEAVRDWDRELPFILFTGKGSEEIASEAISAGVTDYLQKGGSSETYTVLANRIDTCVRRARAERELQNSQEKYRALVEQSLVGIYLLEGGTFTYVNPRMAEIFGYEPEELIGEPPATIIAESDRDLVEENIRRRLDDEAGSIQYTFTGVRTTGEPIEVEVQGTRIELNGDVAISGVLLERSSD